MNKILTYAYLYSFIAVLGVLLLVSCTSHLTHGLEIKSEYQKEVDSLISHSKNSDLQVSERRDALLLAYITNNEESNDSLRLKNLQRIVRQSYRLNDTIFFKKINNEAYELALERKDTLAIADAHWSYATYYVNKEVYDSAYSHYRYGLEYYEGIKNDYYAGKMLYNMAFIKGRLKDYTGSEVLTFQAITKYKDLGKHSAMYNAYNHLAIIYKELDEYDRAIIYNNLALDELKSVKNKGTLYEGSLNNIGLIYHQKENFDKAIEFFNEALATDSIKYENAELYARLIDNRAHSKLRNNDTINLLPEFLESLQIRDSLNILSGVELVQLHLAEYYKKKGSIEQAIDYAEQARALAKEINNKRDYLECLKFLSVTDEINAENYLNEFIRVNDSLQNVERKVRNKFTRIDYETEEYIQEAERLSQQKILILAVSILILLIISLLYFLNLQYAKGKELLFESEQQKANEQIYLLSLKQQAKLNEGKTQERNRIAEELHDGILGKLFGTRMGLGFLVPKLDDNGQHKFNEFITEIQNIEREIRDISHEFKNNNMYSSSIGFFTLVNDLIKSSSELGGFEYKLTKSGDVFWDQVDEIVKTNLYRIIQESLQNTIKHAKAKHVTVDFSMTDDHLILTITDDGVGFNVAKRRTGIGLKNLNSRAKKLNAKLIIESESKKGTKTIVRIPTHQKK